MDNKIDKSTEERIFEAAQQVFLLKGMYGARMQEIADQAGINKALLHYYYRNKENLFLAVFKKIISNFFAKINIILDSEVSAREKLTLFIDNYMELILQNPYFPQFLINETNRNPETLKNLMLESGLDIQKMLELFERTNKQNPSLQLDSRQLIVSMIGMMIFPVAAKPFLQIILFQDDMQQYDQFLKERTEAIKMMMFKMIES